MSERGHTFNAVMRPHPSSALGADPPQKRTTVRITNVYATPWRLNDNVTLADLGDYLRLWRLERHYRISADQLPRVLHREELDTELITFRRWRRSSCLTAARLWLFVLPSGQVVAVFSVDADCGLIETIDLLEDCYFGDVQIGSAPIESFSRNLVPGLASNGRAADDFLPERHQLVFGVTPGEEECEEVTQRLVYRADLPYRKEHSVIRFPDELNRRPGWLAAVGPYVSVVCGHADFIENTVFLSAVQAIAAAAQLREIRQSAYEDVRLYRASEQEDGTTQRRRQVLEHLADHLSELELELSYSVEASADLGLLVPSLRVESFHNALFESMGLVEKADIAGRMLQRLERAIGAELTAIESIERRSDEERRLRWSVAVGFLSTIAVPTGLIFAFFGINASQVNPERSMFDHRYLPVYLVIAAVLMLGAAISFGIYIQQRNGDHKRHGIDASDLFRAR